MFIQIFCSENDRKLNSDCRNSLIMSENSNTTPPQPLFVYHTFAIHLQYICISIVLF